MKGWHVKGNKFCSSCGFDNPVRSMRCVKCSIEFVGVERVQSKPEWLTYEFATKYKKELDKIKQKPPRLRK